MGHDILAHALYKGKKDFSFKILCLWLLKDEEYYVDFNNINLIL
jgi:hypothetical protein